MDRPIEKKHKVTKRVIWISIPSIVFLLLLYSIIFGDKSSKLNVEKDKITIEEITEDLYKNYIAVTGTVEPIQTIYLSSMEGGSRVEEIIIEEGNMVKQGDIIVELSNTSLILEISNYEAQVSRISNELRQARLLMEQQTLQSRSRLMELQTNILQQCRAYDNNKILFSESHISKEEFEISKEQYELSLQQLELLKENLKQDSVFRSVQVEALESSVRRMQQNLEIVTRRLESLNYRAPVSGELANLNLEVGQVINMGQRFGQINILDSYKLRVDIDEYFISNVSKGLFGECDFSGTSFMAIITKVYPEVTNGRFSVDMEFTDTVPEQIRIGQTSRIRLELGRPKTAILIPRGGYYQSTGGQWVYVVDPSGSFAEKRSITLGSQNPRYYEVLDGLQPGEKVVVSSYDNFGDVDKLIFK
ncbi:MAG: HlyD family efflux transporter periplasmic adaptor subunit [Bacteroidales bacterium]|nr:MAG: HlyD family efflux transporter periplasmic adaptor subunit [Bacteroidales bacterium]